MAIFMDISFFGHIKESTIVKIVQKKIIITGGFK